MKQHPTMGTWKVRQLVKGTRASRTPGNKKGLVPPAWARYCARSSRSYKTSVYSIWNAKCDGSKIKWSGAA